MTKTKAIVSLCILLVAVLFFSVFTFLPEVKMGSYTYNSPIRLLTKGQDISDTIVVNFKVDPKNAKTDEFIQENLPEAISTLEKRLASYELNDAQVFSSGTLVTLILPVNSYSDTFYKSLYKKGSFEINTKKDNLYSMVTGAEHFSDVKVTYANEAYYIIMELDQEAKEALAEATEKASEENVTIYFMIDAEEYSSQTLKTTFSDDTLLISTQSVEEAQYLLTILKGGEYPFAMEKVRAWTVTPAAGEQALTWAYIALGAVVVLVFVALIAAYGLTGLAAGISLLATVTLNILAGTFVFMTEFSIAGVFGLILSVVFYALFAALILEKYKTAAANDTEADMTKRLRVSLAKSFDMYKKPLLLTAAMTLVGAIAMWAAAPWIIRPLGIILTYGTVLNVLALLFLTKAFANCFYVLNTRPKCHRVGKEVKND